MCVKLFNWMYFVFFIFLFFRSFPSNYWDKFVKRKVQPSSCLLFNMEHVAFFTDYTNVFNTVQLVYFLFYFFWKSNTWKSKMFLYRFSNAVSITGTKKGVPKLLHSAGYIFISCAWDQLCFMFWKTWHWFKTPGHILCLCLSC